MALLAVRLGAGVGERRHEGILPRQGLLLITLWHPFRTAPEDAVMGEQQAWAKEVRGCMQDKKHSKYQGLPVLSSPFLAPVRGKSGFGSRWQREGAKKEPKMMIHSL